MRDKYPELEPGNYYHIYNRANGSERLFLSDDNYRFFLKKYLQHIEPIVNTYCYCLMPNHFHLLVKVKSEDELIRFFNARAGKNLLGLRIKEKNKQFETNETAELTAKNLEGLSMSENNVNIKSEKSIEKLLTSQFSNFFNSYAKAFNKQQNRMGSLFMKTFKRIKINDEKYFRNVVNYIHHNPVDAKLSSNLEDWKYSSYHILTSKEETFLKREELIEWFHDLENFKIVHRFAPEGGEDIDI